MDNPAVRRVLALVLVGYLAVLLFALLTPVGETPSSSVGWMEDRLRALGAPERLLLSGRVEFLANIAILVPATGLASLLWRKATWRDWTAYGFVFSGSIELFQGLFLAERSATYVDVVANTLGAAVGAIAAAVLVALHQRRLTMRAAGPDDETRFG